MHLYRLFDATGKHSRRPQIEIRKVRSKPYPYAVKNDLFMTGGTIVARFYPMGDYAAGCWDHYYAYLRALKAAGHTLVDKKTGRDELANINEDGTL